MKFLLDHGDKAAALGDAISAVREGREANTVVHAVGPSIFQAGARLALYRDMEVRITIQD